MIVEKETPMIATENRCQATTANGQCVFEAVEGGTVCNMHGGNRQTLSIRNNELYDLKRTQFLKEQHGRMVSNSQWRSVTEEIGILRVTLQSFLSKCQDENDMIRYSGPINNVILSINKAVESSLKLDKHLENLVGKEVLIAIAGDLIEAIYEEIQDPKVCERLAECFKTILSKRRT